MFITWNDVETQIRMTLQSKFLFVVAAICIATLLGACVTSGPPPTPFRLPEIQYGETSESTYLWTRGRSPYKHIFDQADHATITRINDTVLPFNIVIYEWRGPEMSMLVEIPAGELVVEIVYHERSPKFFPFESTSIRSRRVVAFTGEPNRIYVPFASDWCSRDNFWIEDWGIYELDSKVEKSPFIMFSNLTQPVVAGEAPRKGACD
jgi:hypothetical protein